MTQDVPSDAAPNQLPRDPIAHGTFLAVCSAFCYTVSIIALREVKGPTVDWAIWVSCLKAVPVVVSAAVVVAWKTYAGTVRWPSIQGIAWLLLTGFFMQFLGNVTFQWGLHLGGITLTVPLSHATLLISGALLGLWMLGERVSPRSTAAILVLVVSITILSLDADDTLKAGSNAPVGLAIVNGLLAGIGWGLGGVVIRQMVTRGVSVSVTIFLLASTAIVGLGGALMIRQGPGWILEQTSARELNITLLAGVFTAMAFFALTAAMKHISVVRTNIINASQIALTSLAGYALFSEPVTRWMIVGTGLTMGGLLLMDRPRRKGATRSTTT